LEKTADSKAYCDEISGICAERGVDIAELSCHLQSQLVAVPAAYDGASDPAALRQMMGI